MGVSLLCVNSEKIEKHQVYKGLAEKKSNKQVEIKDCSQTGNRTDEVTFQGMVGTLSSVQEGPSEEG